MEDFTKSLRYLEKNSSGAALRIFFFTSFFHKPFTICRFLTTIWSFLLSKKKLMYLQQYK